MNAQEQKRQVQDRSVIRLCQRTNSANDHSLKKLIPDINHIRERTGVPGIAIGVLHHGEVIFTHAEGYRDADEKLPMNVDTAFIIASLTKAFISASCGILVDEGKLQWNDKLNKHVPFFQKNNQFVNDRATISDALSHSTGLAQMDPTWAVLEGDTLLGPEDLLHVTGHLPTKCDLREHWSYNNHMYSLVGRIIEAVGPEKNWGDFVKSRLLKPLGMNRTTTDGTDLKDDNMAEAHYVLNDRTAKKHGRPDLSDKTSMGACASIWSTVPDMLIWAKAHLEAIKIEQSGDGTKQHHVLKNVNKIVSHASIGPADILQENTYGFAWYRMHLPSPAYGDLLLGGRTDEILGRDSPILQIVFHTGEVAGYCANFYLFPHTNSATIALVNAEGFSDPGDWASRLIIQELFDLKPRIDIVRHAEVAAQRSYDRFDVLRKEYDDNRMLNTEEPPKSDISGEYVNDGFKLTISVFEDKADNHRLKMSLNMRRGQTHHLIHYHNDTFSFIPPSREYLDEHVMIDYTHYTQFLLDFDRVDRKVVGLNWIVQPGIPAEYFKRNIQTP